MLDAGGPVVGLAGDQLVHRVAGGPGRRQSTSGQWHHDVGQLVAVVAGRGARREAVLGHPHALVVDPDGRDRTLTRGSGAHARLRAQTETGASARRRSPRLAPSRFKPYRPTSAATLVTKTWPTIGGANISTPPSSATDTRKIATSYTVNARINAASARTRPPVSARRRTVH